MHIKYVRGGWQPCKCPLHEDRTPSASVNTTTDRFHCFVCDINEDVIGMIQKINPGVSYVEAKQEAAEKYGTGTVRMASESDDGSLVSHFKGNRRANGRGFQAWRRGLS